MTASQKVWVCLVPFQDVLREESGFKVQSVSILCGCSVLKSISIQDAVAKIVSDWDHGLERRQSKKTP